MMTQRSQSTSSFKIGLYREVTLFSIASIMVFSALFFTPILEVSRLGLANEASIFTGAHGLWNEGMPIMGLLIGAVIYWIPILVMSLVLLHISICYRDQSNRPTQPLRIAHGLRQWAMPEVFLLAILVAFLKIGELADVQLQLGLVLFVLGTILMVITFEWVRRIHPLETAQDRPHAKRSIQAPIALGISACILLIPANILPIMQVKTSDDFQKRNILGGVVGLIEHGLWGIATIVFIASIIVPIAKLAGLGWLCWTRHRREYRSRWDERIYLIIESIGRWSMLDVFLVGFLTGLIQFGDFSHVKPGPATVPFAAAVILTIFAVQQLDLPEREPTIESER